MLNPGGSEGTTHVCACVSHTVVSGEPGAGETMVNGALIFGRTEATIMLKTINYKAMKLKGGNEAEKRFNNRLKKFPHNTVMAIWYKTA